MELPPDVRTIPAAEVEAISGPAGLLGHGALGEVRAGRWQAAAPGPAAADAGRAARTTAVALKQLFFMREDAESVAALGGELSPEDRHNHLL